MNNTILLFVIPPIAGAIIAYSTNVIAIKMLFRPLMEKRIFGIKIPFTPGVLPRHRHKLAQSIGAMVERELLTPEILRERLSREDVRLKIKQSLSLFTENFLEKTPGELFDGNQNFLSEKVTGAAEKLYPVLSSVFLQFLKREDIRRELEARGRIFLRNLFLQLNVFQRFFLSAGQYDLTLEQKMPEIISDLIANAGEMIQDSRVKKILINAVSSSVGQLICGQNRNINSLLDIGEDEKRKLDNYIFEKLISTVDKQIEGILASINVKELVSQRIDSLEMQRVERIILDIMSDQFKWIYIFGGILGFLIGAFQAVLTFFLR